MKTCGVAVALAVVLALICIQESSAVPITDVPELEARLSDHNDQFEFEVAPVDSDMPNKRQKRGADCSFCCSGGGCGVCCRF